MFEKLHENVIIQLLKRFKAINYVLQPFAVYKGVSRLYLSTWQYYLQTFGERFQRDFENEYCFPNVYLRFA